MLRRVILSRSCLSSWISLRGEGFLRVQRNTQQLCLQSFLDSKITWCGREGWKIQVKYASVVIFEAETFCFNHRLSWQPLVNFRNLKSFAENGSDRLVHDKQKHENYIS